MFINSQRKPVYMKEVDIEGLLEQIMPTMLVYGEDPRRTEYIEDCYGFLKRFTILGQNEFHRFL